MSLLLEKLADAAVQEQSEMQNPIKRGVDGTDGGKANVKALSEAGGSLDLGAGSDVFHFGGKKGVSGTVDMGEETGTSGDRFDKDRDIVRLKKDLSEYTITEVTDGSGEFNITDNSTGTSITFAGVEIIRTKSETFNLKKVSIAEVIAQSENGTDWSGNNRATLNDLEVGEELKMGAGRDTFHFNDLNKTGSGTVDFGYSDGVVDRVVLQGSIGDYTIKSAGVNTWQVTKDGSTVDFVGLGAEDLFVFRNVEKSAGQVTANYENDIFKTTEMAEAVGIVQYVLPAIPDQYQTPNQKIISDAELDMQFDWTIA